MTKSKFMKCASLFVAGSWMLQFGGCGGDFFQLMLRNVPVGAGRALGAIPAGIIQGFINPFLAGLMPAV